MIRRHLQLEQLVSLIAAPFPALMIRTVRTGGIGYKWDSLHDTGYKIVVFILIQQSCSLPVLHGTSGIINAQGIVII